MKKNWGKRRRERISTAKRRKEGKISLSLSLIIIIRRRRQMTTRRRRNDKGDEDSRESSPSSTLLDPAALLRNRSPASSSKPPAFKATTSSQKSYYTVDDVSKHDRENDCWVIVHDRVYDVTTFVPKHPGGNMIRVNAGGECTALFESYHPLKARAVLEKFYIGDVVEEKKKKNDNNNNNSETKTKSERMKAPKYREIGEEDEFHFECKRAAEKYFRENKLDPREHPEMWAKSFAILSGIVLFHYLSFFSANVAFFPLACVFAVLHGVCKAEVGVSIQHDANHGAYSKNRKVLHAMQLTLDIVGASSFMWKQQHVVGHHAFTNVESIDPDIRCDEKNDVRRVNYMQPHAFFHRAQHVYLAFLYGLLSFKSCFFDDFSARKNNKIGWVTVPKFQRREFLEFWGYKAIWAFYYLYLPFKYSPHNDSYAKLFALWTLTEFTTGWLLAFMFQVAHVTPDVEFFKVDEKTGVISSNKSWAEAQLSSSADFAHGSKFWTHFSGGLNYQVIHHLFPGVCHVHYPQLAPLVMDVCKKRGLEYIVYPTFWAALRAHFRHLKMVGRGAFKVPSLHTVG